MLREKISRLFLNLSTRARQVIYWPETSERVTATSLASFELYTPSEDPRILISHKVIKNINNPMLLKDKRELTISNVQALELLADSIDALCDDEDQGILSPLIAGLKKIAQSQKNSEGFLVSLQTIRDIFDSLPYMRKYLENDPHVTSSILALEESFGAILRFNQKPAHRKPPQSTSAPLENTVVFL